MPLVAETQCGERVESIHDRDLREVYEKGDVLCPLCDKPMFVRGGEGTTVIQHFVHGTPCTSELARNESTEHLQAKAYIASMQRDIYQKAPQEITVELEKTVGTHVRRRPDVLVTRDDGERIAHEIQISTIPLKQVTRRTSDYQLLDIHVLWYFESKCVDEKIDRWCREGGRSSLWSHAHQILRKGLKSQVGDDWFLRFISHREAQP